MKCILPVICGFLNGISYCPEVDTLLDMLLPASKQGRKKLKNKMDNDMLQTNLYLNETNLKRIFIQVISMSSSYSDPFS